MKKSTYFTIALTAIFMLLIGAVIRFIPITNNERTTVKVGFLLDGDEATPYSENFLAAIGQVEAVYGDSFEAVIKYNVKEDVVEKPLQELIAEDCDLIFGCSYGYQYLMKDYAANYPDIQFCQATGDLALQEPVLSNYHDFMGEIYQGRYIVGQVAGLKLQEMIDEGIISVDEAKIGYVAAFPYAEVISGYTAFFLGVRSIVPEATMEVMYADTWNDYSIEKQLATELIEDGCCIISQHSDTIGPAVACENADSEIPIYHVGYNDSMTEIAPSSSLISCKINFEPYIESAVEALLANQRIEDVVDGNVHGDNDVSAGFEKDWVQILDINEVVAPEGTQELVEDSISRFKAGEITVFKGDYTGVNPDDDTDTIDLRDGYIENEFRSSPAFDYVLEDVITLK